MGVLNLHTHNQSLLLKNLHKFFNQLDIPWVHLIWTVRYPNGRPPALTRKGSFWWRDIQKLLAISKGMAAASVNNGSSCFFWLDTSWNVFSLSTSMPELLSFVKDKFTSVEQVCQSPAFHGLFHLPLSVEAYQQFIDLSNVVANLHLQEGFDRRTYIWNSPKFTSKQAHVHLIGRRQVHQAFS